MEGGIINTGMSRAVWVSPIENISRCPPGLVFLASEDKPKKICGDGTKTARYGMNDIEYLKQLKLTIYAVILAAAFFGGTAVINSDWFMIPACVVVIFMAVTGIKDVDGRIQKLSDKDDFHGKDR